MKTKNGLYIRFKVSEISEMKKTSVGVRGIKLKNDDVVDAVAIGSTKSYIGDFPFTSIKLTKRDGVGVKKSLTSP
jgi:DNA gyrase subunit A